MGRRIMGVITRDDQDEGHLDAVGIRRTSARAGLSASGLWLAGEIAVRWGGLIVAGLLSHGRLFAAESLGPLTIVNDAVLVLAMLALYGLFARRRRLEGLTPAQMGYRVTVLSGVAGAGCGAAMFAMLLAAAAVDDRYFGLFTIRPPAEGYRAAGPIAGAVLVLGNVLLAPAVEEFAWRGYIHTKLVSGWGAPAGLCATALLFAGKHIVVDLSLARTVTLVVASLGLGLVRMRWGTFASTIAHLALNLTGSAIVLSQALRK